MNKGQLIEAVQKKLEKTPQKPLQAAVNAVFDSITKAVKEPVQVIGFGTFKKVSRKARTGVNPQDPTGPKIKIKASRSVSFKAGAKLKAAV